MYLGTGRPRSQEEGFLERFTALLNTRIIIPAAILRWFPMPHAHIPKFLEKHIILLQINEN